MSFRQLTEREQYVIKMIVDAAFAVNKKLGSGLLEKVYEVCFCSELSKWGLKKISTTSRHSKMRDYVWMS